MRIRNIIIQRHRTSFFVRGIIAYLYRSKLFGPHNCFRRDCREAWVISCHTKFLPVNHIISYHVILYYILSYHIIPFHIIPFYIISCHISLSYYIISYIIISSTHIDSFSFYKFSSSSIRNLMWVYPAGTTAPARF